MDSDQRQSVLDGNKETAKGKASVRTVGETLARAREEKGKSLRDVANILRIRYTYLKAIEKGDFANLPGDAYAYGFTRTYADFLELDEAEIIRRFKQEVENCCNKPDLQFPQPDSEGKMPGFAVFFVAFALFVLAYVGWLAVSSEGERFDPRDLVPGIVFERSAPTSQGQESDPEAAVTDPTSGGLPKTATKTETPKPDSPGPDSVASVEGDALERATAPGAKEIASQENQRSETEITSPLEEEQRPLLQSKEGASQEAHKTPAAGTSQTDHSEAFKRDVFGAKAGRGSSVSFLAILDTWIQIQSKEGRLLFGRVLRAGDRYNVFKGEGQVMKIGNAGGVKVFIKGREQPIIGAVGKVMSNIPLDAEALETFLAAH